MLSRYDQWKLASPPDFSPAYEDADDEFGRGGLEDEFRAAFDELLADGLDYEEEEGDYDRRVAEADEAAARAGVGGRWSTYRDAVGRLFPRTYEAARERVTDARAEEIIDERGGRGW